MSCIIVSGTLPVVHQPSASRVLYCNEVHFCVQVVHQTRFNLLIPWVFNLQLLHLMPRSFLLVSLFACSFFFINNIVFQKSSTSRPYVVLCIMMKYHYCVQEFHQPLMNLFKCKLLIPAFLQVASFKSIYPCLINVIVIMSFRACWLYWIFIFMWFYFWLSILYISWLFPTYQ